jgi:vancomycin aglycone glucosyltransferase
MRELLSTIGSRADVQPVVALALQLRELGQEVHACAPLTSVMDRRPRDPLRSHRTRVCAIQRNPAHQLRGPSLTRAATSDGGRRGRGPVRDDPGRSRRRDVIVAATALQIAARSVAEQRGIGSVYGSQPQPDSPGPPRITRYRF